MTIHEKYISEVNDLAYTSAQKGYDPFAAILVKGNEIKASAVNLCIEHSDPTAHAELSLISQYCKQNDLISLEDYTLYANVEPCVMCSGAIHWARISTVVFSVSQASLQKISGGKKKPSCDQLINTGHQKTTVVGPVLEADGLKVFQAFPFQSKKERHQIFYNQKRAKEDVLQHNDFYCSNFLSNKIEVDKVWESANVLAFHHTNPFWEHHVVVIPKIHVDNVYDLSDESVLEQDLFKAIKFVSKMMKEKIGGCRVSTNVGEYQSTKHLHFYVHAGERIRGEKV